MQPMLLSNRVCKYRRNIYSSCRQEWTKAKCYKDGFFKITIHLLMQKLSDVARVVSVVFLADGQALQDSWEFRTRYVPTGQFRQPPAER